MTKNKKTIKVIPKIKLNNINWEKLKIVSKTE